MTDTAATEVAEPAPEAAAAPAHEVESEDNRTARQKVLDFLEDTEGQQTVAQIIAGTGLVRNTAEQAIFRAVQSEQIERVAQGTYKLARPKPKPPPPPKPEPPAPASFRCWPTPRSPPGVPRRWPPAAGTGWRRC